MADLLPCPHCGSSRINIHCHRGASRSPTHYGADVYSLGCYDCGATVPNMYQRELLVDAWNRRSSAILALPDLLAALKPFAECCDQIADTESPEEWAKFRLLVKNYRAARDAVAKAEGRDQ
jgi:Lar family restriction alleviation protein